MSFLEWSRGRLMSPSCGTVIDSVFTGLSTAVDIQKTHQISSRRNGWAVVHFNFKQEHLFILRGSGRRSTALMVVLIGSTTPKGTG